MKERFFIYYNGISHFDFEIFNSEQEAIARAKEAVDEGKGSTVWVGKLLKVARRNVAISDE